MTIIYRQSMWNMIWNMNEFLTVCIQRLVIETNFRILNDSQTIAIPNLGTTDISCISDQAINKSLNEDDH